ncbi:MAG: hypothetical protein JSS29_02185 [Proteobacteria bacterium]|nr:hypothetical protein [Pseudomonadota bacterium]
MPRRSSIRGSRGVLVALALALACAAATADDTEWRDYEARIQYAFYTEDVRALKSVVAALAQSESHDRLRAYFSALAAWREAQLAPRQGTGKGPSVGDYLQQCVRELEPVLSSQPDFAEGYALRAACAATPAGGLHVPFTGPSPARDAARALGLAPRNPRALFAQALTDYLHAGAGPIHERALAELKRAVAAFEAEREGPTPLPGWGAAEAYLLLGRDLMDHGDGAGARDALEHALLLVPDYAEARRLLGKLTAG